VFFAGGGGARKMAAAIGGVSEQKIRDFQPVSDNRFHMRLKALCHAVQKADKLLPDKSQSSHP